MEVTVSTLLVGIVTVGAMRSLGSSVKSGTETASKTQAVLMAEEMIIEILSQDYSEPDGIPVFGRDNGESADTRATWDDVDDYHNWSASPPVDRSGDPIASDEWQRTVTIDHVAADDLQTSLGTDNDQGVKRITVRMLKNDEELVSLQCFQTRAWISMIPEPGNYSTTGQSPPVNQAPAATFSQDQSVGTASVSVQFDAGSSSDPEDQPLNYEWDFGDGQAGSGESVSHLFTNSTVEAVVFEVVLTVTDIHGAANTHRSTVTVHPN
jgi:type II secretory pathway pseudopilin PulG